VGYRMKIKKKPIDYINDDIAIVVAIDDFNNKFFDEIGSLIESPNDRADFESFKKNISNLYLLSDYNSKGQPGETIVIIDPGFYYYPAIFKIDDYFEKDKDEKNNEIYKLRDEFLEKVKEIYPKIKNIYGDYSNGLFFISDEINSIKKFKDNLSSSQNSEKNKKIKNILKDGKNNIYNGILSVNKNMPIGIEMITNSLNFNKKEATQNISVYLDNEPQSVFYNNQNNRKINKVTGDNYLYVSVDDFLFLYKGTLLLADSFKYGSQFYLLQAVTGIKFNHELENINGEILLSLDDNSLKIALKDPQRLKKIFKNFNIDESEFLSVDEENKIADIKLHLESENVSHELKNLKNKEIKMDKNQFVSGEISLAKIQEFITEKYKMPDYYNHVKINIKGEEKLIKIQLISPEDKFIEEIKRMITKNKNIL
jgi:hypothetical protein